MQSQHGHNLSHARGPSRGSQATSQRKQSKHQKPSQPTQSPFKEAVTQHVSLKYQQSILDTFTLAFPIASQEAAFTQILQEVKGHLYNRDFSAAFGKPEYLDVYASRWSAARALAYADIFMNPDRHAWFQPLIKTTALSDSGSGLPRPDLAQHSDPLTPPHPSGLTESKTEQTRLRVDNDIESPEAVRVNESTSIHSSHHPAEVRQHFKIACVGGGAGAELVALAATWRYLNSKLSTDSELTQYTQRPAPGLDILAIDVADWSEALKKLSITIAEPPPISNHASRTARETNRALIQPEADGIVNINFKHENVLDLALDSLRSILSDISLVTIMFTLNELFTSSLPKTTTLLLNLTESMNVGAHLVVVDSPGSYSEIKLGKPSSKEQGRDAANAIKRYPMKWLLDHTLLEVAGKGEDTRWVKIEDEDSKWFRIDEKAGLRYNIALENCRYQIHAFRKLK